ncbi:hypothetical protein [Nonomuraea sp. NPDC050310]|uniref:hypothetical protein n=1 Tax=Nonomuraea sp. NPDC050310 TaxID=3154935 RepID=UPI0033EECB52
MNNGFELQTAQPSVRELREQLAMAEALEPIELELQAAKQAYRDALEDGDPQTIAAAKQRKQDAANHINETRTWLRRERRIAKLLTQIPALEERLAGQILDDDGREDADLRAQLQARLAGMREELPVLEAEAAPLRELFGTPQPSPVVVEDGSADVDAPAVTATAKARTGKGN